jgi:sec-independent protein translocase protein TatA
MFNNPWELMIVAAIIFLLFGNRLPSVMRSLGRGVTEFKKGVAGIEDDADHAAPPKERTPEENKGQEPEKKPSDEEHARSAQEPPSYH